jgi:hypothetical protein
MTNIYQFFLQDKNLFHLEIDSVHLEMAFHRYLGKNLHMNFNHTTTVTYTSEII